MDSEIYTRDSISDIENLFQNEQKKKKINVRNFQPFFFFTHEQFLTGIISMQASTDNILVTLISSISDSYCFHLIRSKIVSFYSNNYLELKEFK